MPAGGPSFPRRHFVGKDDHQKAQGRRSTHQRGLKAEGQHLPQQENRTQRRHPTAPKPFAASAAMPHTASGASSVPEVRDNGYPHTVSAGGTGCVG